MKTTESKPLAHNYTSEQYQEVVVRSSLWAAAGDALGWITELSGGQDGVQFRSGSKSVSETVKWKRKIGGRFGVSVDLPAGTYSDDTQLRLCVARAIRGNGVFDVEAFAKIELPVWQSYSLGAGIGSMAAAENLSKRNVNWFSNFFHTKKQQYTNAGGNGAAMRIQPHVWSSRNSVEELLTQVLRDALVTHGHPHGFCGAVFHALCLREVIITCKIPSIDKAFAFLDIMDIIPSLIDADSDLSTFWKGNWEAEANIDFKQAIADFKVEALADVDQVVASLSHNRQPGYHEILGLLGCLTPKFRGSGFKTAFAAFVLAVINKNEPIENALILSANELDSDTDTIATMAGALLGAVSSCRPKWVVQDDEYLISEAVRLALIGLGQAQMSFGYPDLATWVAPVNQSDAVATFDNGVALAGLGGLRTLSKEFISKDSKWQWFQLPFGQSILAKRRKTNINTMYQSQMPTQRLMSSPSNRVAATPEQFSLEKKMQKEVIGQDTSESHHKRDVFRGIDHATSEVINSGFDDIVFGRLLNLCIEDTDNIESAMAFAAIVAKAKLARKHRAKNNRLTR
ncbi:MAG: ADP-ribosylglycohydrolase family protein [Sedimenticola sp.]